MKKITINGQPAKKGKNFSKETRGERWELISPTNRHLKGYFVSKFWHSGTEFIVFKAGRQGSDKRILRKCGCSPNKQEKATQTVIAQAKLLCKEEYWGARCCWQV